MSRRLWAVSIACVALLCAIAMCGVGWWLLPPNRGDEIAAPRPPRPADRHAAPLPETETPAVAEATPAESERPGEVPQVGEVLGDLVVSPRRPSFTVPRDYNHRVALEIANRGAEPRRVRVDVPAAGHGLLLDVVGPGTRLQPIELQPGESTEIWLYTFAQDADREAFHLELTLVDADTDTPLSTIPLDLLVPWPDFDVEVGVDEQQPGTLARGITLVNLGGPLTDLTVTAGSGLAGQVLLQPAVQHAYLVHDERLTFAVVPVLSPTFGQLEGELTVQAAGQEKLVHVRFDLPPGERVLVASSFSTRSTSSTSWYCTNRPNVDSPIGGWFEGPIPPSSADNPFLPDGDWGWQWFRVGPYRVRTIFGPSVLPPNWGGGTSAPYRRSSLPPLGAPPSTPAIPPDVAPDEDERPTGDEPRNDDPDAVEFAGAGGQHHGPRGLDVRPVYAAYRPAVMDDNRAEGTIAYGAGPADSRDLLHVWHSTMTGPEGGRQILFQAWDGRGRTPLTSAFALAEDGLLAQWPSVATLPERRAIVAWEETPGMGQPTVLRYRVSEPGYARWTEAQTVTLDAADAAGCYDPVPAVGSDGMLLLFWQAGAGANARIRVARWNDEGHFDPPETVPGLPPGAGRPIPRFAADGALLLAFVAVEPAGAGAVYVAESRDGGNAFDVVRVSPQGVDAGEPDLLPHGERIHAVYREGPNWQSRIMYSWRPDAGGPWQAPVAATPEGSYAEYSSLLPEREGRVRVEYYGNATPADSDPSAVPTHTSVPPETAIRRFMVRPAGDGWGQPLRLLTRFPTVQAAWLQVHFRLRTNRVNFLPHEIAVLLNGEELFHATEVVPEGTYLLPFDPSLLRRDFDGTPHNVIGVRTKHMSAGNYSSATDFRLQSRHRLVERLVVAKSQEEADAILAAETAEANHRRADIGLFAAPDAEPLPARPELSQAISVPLLLGNLGESSATNVRVEVLGEPPRDGVEQQALSAPIPLADLPPMRDFRVIQVPLIYDGRDEYFIVVRHDGDDFDPANNVHVVSFAAPPAPEGTPVSPAGDLQLASFDAATPPYLCRFLDGQTGEEIARAVDGSLEAPLPSGRYRLAITRFQFEGQEVLWPDIYNHTEGEPLQIEFRSAVELVLPPGTPELYRWEALPADDPERIVQWYYGNHTVMALPPGRYRVAIHPGPDHFGCTKLLWDEEVVVGRDEHVAISLQSGVRLELTASSPLYSWKLVSAANPEQVLQYYWNAMAEERTMLAPPGEYRLVVHPRQFDSREIEWPEPVVVEPNDVTTVRLNSGVRFALMPEAGDVYSWSLYAAGEPAGAEPVQSYWSGSTLRFMLVPPGEYRLAAQPSQFTSLDQLWPATVVVQPESVTEVRLASGVRLTLHDQANDVYEWSLFREDDAEQRDPVQQYWPHSERRLMLAPPGNYRLAFKPRQFDSQRIVWPGVIRVVEGEVTPVGVGSGFELSLPAEANDIYSWSLMPAGQPDRIAQTFWSNSPTRLALVPPGDYQVAIHPSQFDSKELIWPTSFTVPPDDIVRVRIDGGVRLELPDEANDIYSWSLVAADRPEQIVQQFWASSPARIALAPPGTYRVALRPRQFDGNEIVWPDPVEVGVDAWTTAAIASGIRFVADDPGTKPSFQFRVLARGEDDVADPQIVQRGPGKWTAELLPPGRYTVEVRFAETDDWIALPQPIEVQASQVVEIRLPAGGGR